MIPFVTEEIYRYVPGAEGLLAAGACPAEPRRGRRGGRGRAWRA